MSKPFSIKEMMVRLALCLVGRAVFSLINTKEIVSELHPIQVTKRTAAAGTGETNQQYTEVAETEELLKEIYTEE